MNDIAQVNLSEPPKTDWDNYGGSGKFQVPPPALDAKGEPIVYYGQAGSITEKVNDYALNPDTGQPYLNFALDPFVIATGDFKGYILKYVEVNVKPFMKNNKPTGSHSLGNYLRAAGVAAKPQTNDEYRAAIKLTASKLVGFTIDWQAKNKETAEEIKGFLAFPEDDSRPGQRKCILKAGDFYNVLGPDRKPTGELAKVKSEILFANARLRFFRDASRSK